MPIRINLLAEAQAAEEMRRKDPVKRAVWIGGFAVFVVLLCAATLQFKIIVAKSEVSGLRSQIVSLMLEIKVSIQQPQISQSLCQKKGPEATCFRTFH